jgi:hypothetical protein
LRDIGARRAGIAHPLVPYALIRHRLRNSSSRGSRFFVHSRHAVSDRAVVDGTEKQRRSVLLIGIEDHVPGHAVVFFDIRQRVVNARAIQPRLAYRIQQHVHGVEGHRSELLRLFVEAVLEALVEIQPARVVAGGVVRVHGLEALGGIASFFQQRIAQGAIRAKDALLHPRSPHLLQNGRCLQLISHQKDGVRARVADHPQLLGIIRVAGLEDLLHHHRMAQPAGGIKEFGKAITAVSAACPENRHALQAKLGIDVAGERQILLPVILHGAEVPGNGGLGNCGIAVRRAYDRKLRAQSHTQRNVRRLGADGAEDRPYLVVVGHLDGFVGGRAPDGGVGGPDIAIDRLGLPVVVIVMRHQLERLATIAAAGIGLFHRQLRAVQHAQSKNRFRIMFDRTKEADTHLGHVFRLGNVSRRADVDVGTRVVGVIGRCKLGIRSHVGRFTRIGHNLAIARRTRRMLAAFAHSPGRVLQRRRGLARKI